MTDLSSLREDWSEDEDGDLISSTNYKFSYKMFDGTFSMLVKESEFEDEVMNLNVTLLNNVGTEVGSMDAYLIPRSWKLYGRCDSINEEINDVGDMFFTENGQIRTERIEGLNKEDLEEFVPSNRLTGSEGGFISSKKLGNLLYIYEVKISHEYRGNSLSLIMINKFLDHLEDRWTIAFLSPFTLTRDSSSGSDLYRAHLSLARHFAKLGFRQASQCYNDWEIISSGTYSYQCMMDVLAGFPRGSASCYWYLVPKDRIYDINTEFEDLNVFVPNSQYKQLNNLDRSDLKENHIVVCVASANKNPTDEQLENVSDMVLCGEDINQSEALFFASFDGKISMIKKMIELGADVNHRNSELETPLHIAASNLQLDTCKALLQLGADKDLRNKGGMKPVDYAVVMNEDISLHRAKFGHKLETNWDQFRRLATYNIVSRTDQLEVMKLLMDDPTLLVGGVLSSKMFQRLQIVAEVAGDECREFMPEFKKEILSTDEKYGIEFLIYVRYSELPAEGICVKQ